MIPKITHSRSQLTHCYLNPPFEDGARTFFVPLDTYPDVFKQTKTNIFDKAPQGWKISQTGKMKYLWFPPGVLDQNDIASIKEWQDKFSHYVLLGLNNNIVAHFTEELDFSMALDYNRFPPPNKKRTIYGEAEYQLKYQDSRPHFQVLRNALVEAVGELPIPKAFDDSYCISCIPGSPEKRTIPRRLAKKVANDLDVDFVDANLNCTKAGLKNVSVEDKIPIWQQLYDDACVEIVGDIEDKLVIVVDDLYQSGVTLWSFAKFLKEQGAKHVFGLPCVKSLRDSDNQ